MTVACCNLIIFAVNSQLTAVLKDGVAPTDMTRAGLIKPGLLQDDPTRYKVNILTHQNDPDDEKGWKHIVLDSTPDEIHKNPPAYEIGGGEMWYRRFTTELELFLKPGLSKDEARDISNVILSRAEYALALTNVSSASDDFGEYPVELYVVSSKIDQGGGDDQSIYYGKIWWQVLTGKNY